jgi:periplasmic divalent cation tolerance protein
MGSAGHAEASRPVGAGEPLVNVYTTVGSEADALALSRGLVAAGLAACVNRWPIRSVFTWDGQTDDVAEVGLLVKTREGLVPALRTWFDSHHPYDLPCCEVFGVETAGPFAAWVRAVATGEPASS